MNHWSCRLTWSVVSQSPPPPPPPPSSPHDAASSASASTPAATILECFPLMRGPLSPRGCCPVRSPTRDAASCPIAVGSADPARRGDPLERHRRHVERETQQ